MILPIHLRGGMSHFYKSYHCSLAYIQRSWTEEKRWYFIFRLKYDGYKSVWLAPCWSWHEEHLEIHALTSVGKKLDQSCRKTTLDDPVDHLPVAAWQVTPSYPFQFLRREVWGEGAGKHHLLQRLWWGFLPLSPLGYVAWSFPKKTQMSAHPDLTSIADQSNNSIQVCLGKPMTSLA